MANTYSQIYVQIVFTLKGRQSLIKKQNRSELQQYMSGIVAKREQKLLAIFAMPDHIHLLIGIQPNILISDLVRDIKAGSSKFISDNNWVKGRFAWQKGYGVFSYSNSQVDRVIKYILNQEEHHKKRSFKKEYLNLLKRYEIPYDDKYLFEWME